MLKTPISALIGILGSIVVLLGYFIQIPLLIELRSLFLQWAIILASIALFVGVIKLFSAHVNRVLKRERGYIYSVIIILSLLLTIVFVGTLGLTNTWSLWLFNNVQIPIESSLTAVLGIVLVYALARFLIHKFDFFTIVFVLTVLILLVGSIPIFGIYVPGISGENGLRGWIQHIFALGGIRGILLGIALGSVATGLRFLIGSDRPYGE